MPGPAVAAAGGTAVATTLVASPAWGGTVATPARGLPVAAAARGLPEVLGLPATVVTALQEGQ